MLAPTQPACAVNELFTVLTESEFLGRFVATPREGAYFGSAVIATLSLYVAARAWWRERKRNIALQQSVNTLTAQLAGAEEARQKYTQFLEQICNQKLDFGGKHHLDRPT